MSATVNFSVYKEAHSKMVTCYRPIVLATRVSGNIVPSHFEAHLYIERFNYNDDWIDTGVRANAYYDSKSPEEKTFSINIAEYCRQYFTEDYGFYEQDWCNNFRRMADRRFKVYFYPVQFVSGGTLVTDYDNVKITRSFSVIPTVTRDDEITDTANSNIRLDKFVCNVSNNSGILQISSDKQKLLSNMPQNQTIDLSKGFYYFYQYLHSGGNSNRRSYIRITNNTTGTYYDLETPDWDYNGYFYFNLHPSVIEFMIAMDAGAFQGLLLTAGGALQTDSMTIQAVFKSTATWAVIRTAPAMTYKLKDNENSDGTCNSKYFVFRNMRGGFDWFEAKGSQFHELSIDSSEYDRVKEFSRYRSDFDLLDGEHHTSKLWGNRKEGFTVFTQVNKETANWLTELISSTQVWVIEKTIDGPGFTPGEDSPIPGNDYPDAYGTRLVPININKGSYKIHNTEKRINYIEFKYTLSANSLVQKT